MPVFIAKYNEHKHELNDQLGDVNLLGTIKIPQNLSLLNQRLPEAQYEQEQKPEKPESARQRPLPASAAREVDYLDNQLAMNQNQQPKP